MASSKNCSGAAEAVTELVPHGQTSSTVVSTTVILNERRCVTATNFNRVISVLSFLQTKIQSRVIWVLVMFIMGTTDMMLAWFNWMDLMDSNLQRVLVIGAPQKHMTMVLLGFTVLGTILYILETCNTFSVFRCDGVTRVPVIHELIFIIALEHIPLSCINYIISKCRHNYATMYQTCFGACQITYILIRLVWFAHMQGKILKKKEGAHMRKLPFMLVCALFSCCMTFPVMMWKAKAPSVKEVNDTIESVGIYFFRASFLENEHISDPFLLNDLLPLQGRSVDKPYLVEQLDRIRKSKDYAYIVRYDCDFIAPESNTNVTFLPTECKPGNLILFNFVYQEYSLKIYGTVKYNFAIYDRQKKICTDSMQDFQDNWKVYYYNTTVNNKRSIPQILITSPWQKSCKTPVPWYNPDVKVCRHSCKHLNLPENCFDVHRNSTTRIPQ